jgi:hypothetical protein
LKGSLMYPKQPLAVSIRPTQVVPERGIPVTRIGRISSGKTLGAFALSRDGRVLCVKTRVQKRRRALVLLSGLRIRARPRQLHRRLPARGEIRAAWVHAAP